MPFLPELFTKAQQRDMAALEQSAFGVVMPQPYSETDWQWRISAARYLARQGDALLLTVGCEGQGLDDVAERLVEEEL